MNVTTSVTPDLDLTQAGFLVVESKPHFREIAHNALMRGRARDVKYAPDVDEALQVLRRFGQQITGIICDWDLTPVGGLELLRGIRSGKHTRIPRDMCVVILTGQPDAAAVKAAMQLDVNGFAIAPLSVEKFIKTLGLAIQRQTKLRDVAQYAAVVLPSIAEDSARPTGVGGSGMLHSASRKGAGAEKPSASVKESELVNVRMCTLSQLEAGTILARDLSDRDGHLLLKAGAPLSKALLERLNDVSGNHAEAYHVWVGERRAAQ